MADHTTSSTKKITQFVSKTYSFVDDPSTDSLISWSENGTSLVIRRFTEFARDLLPLHFKHNNFSSFTHQLYNYGFKKVKRGEEEFANEYFRRGQKGLLPHIQRRKAVRRQNPTFEQTSNSMMNSGITELVTPIELATTRYSELLSTTSFLSNANRCAESLEDESVRLIGVPIGPKRKRVRLFGVLIDE